MCVSYVLFISLNFSFFFNWHSNFSLSLSLSSINGNNNNDNNKREIRKPCNFLFCCYCFKTWASPSSHGKGRWEIHQKPSRLWNECREYHRQRDPYGQSQRWGLHRFPRQSSSNHRGERRRRSSCRSWWAGHGRTF